MEEKRNREGYGGKYLEKEYILCSVDEKPRRKRRKICFCGGEEKRRKKRKKLFGEGFFEEKKNGEGTGGKYHGEGKIVAGGRDRN